MSVRDDFFYAVEAMTNYERNQWARAGYPGMKDRDETKVKPFLGLGADRRIVKRKARP